MIKWLIDWWMIATIAWSLLAWHFVRCWSTTEPSRARITNVNMSLNSKGWAMAPLKGPTISCFLYIHPQRTWVFQNLHPTNLTKNEIWDILSISKHVVLSIGLELTFLAPIGLAEVIREAVKASVKASCTARLKECRCFEKSNVFTTFLGLDKTDMWIFGSDNFVFGKMVSKKFYLFFLVFMAGNPKIGMLTCCRFRRMRGSMWNANWSPTAWNRRPFCGTGNNLGTLGQVSCWSTSSAFPNKFLVHLWLPVLFFFLREDQYIEPSQNCWDPKWLWVNMSLLPLCTSAI